MEHTIYYSEFGCIVNAWVTISGRASVCVGRRGDADSILIERALTHWANVDAYKIKENELRSAYPDKQLYSGSLPGNDTDWTGEEGWYLYCLKDRKRHGKYQVLEALKI